MEDLAFMYIQSKNVNGQPILKRVYKKEYVARRVNGESAVEILEEKLTSDNTTSPKVPTGAPWPCKFSDSSVCAAKDCNDGSCDIYEPA